LIEVEPMDIEESSVPYRAFLRSGSYPALTQRVVRSGGVLAQAAGWFALVVTAASGGYNLTQRLATQPTAAPSEALVRPATRPVLASSLGMVLPSAAVEGVENLSVPDGIADARPRGARAAVATIASVVADTAEAAAPARKRTGAVAQPVQMQPSVEATPDQAEPARAEQIAGRVRAIDSSTPGAKAPESAPVQAAPDPIDAVLRDSIERQRVAALAGKAAPRELRAPAKAALVAPPGPPSQPLAASARVEDVAVRGPLSAAQLRRSVERVRPTLSECYGDAARRAGYNRFSQVTVFLTIDEAGRVKAHPKVEGAQLPGFEGCVSATMSKLVCQAPDTGTAKASIVLAFGPGR
jgi:hypothetical protein